MKSFRNLTAVIAAAAAVALAACQAKDAGQSASTDTHTTQSTADVTHAWNPPAVTEVLGVPAAELHAAIAQRVTGPRPSGLGDDHWGHLKRLYSHYGNSPLWMDQSGVITNRASALTSALLSADSSDALDLSEYPIAEITQGLRAVKQANGHPTAAQVAEADVALTAAYVALGEDMMVGQVSPSSMNQNWHIDPRDEAIDGSLMHGLANDALDTSLLGMRPQGEDYVGLQKALAQYRAIAAHGGWSPVPAGRALKPGERDTPARLEALRARLRAEGYEVGTPAATAAGTTDSGSKASRAPNGSRAPNATAVPNAAGASSVYDRALAGAVAQFQAAHAIDVDSILGTGTVQSMNKPIDYRVAQIAANMERMRWLPRSLGSRYVYVNVPAFHLTAFDSGQKTLDMKVVVGQNYEDKTTPSFADSMETVVFRPYWNITPDIQAKEIEPKIASDPGYMDSQQLEYYKDGGVTRIRQKPGDKNSLGFVKFLFPNDYNIYLHDTPAKELFNKDVRAFSHGCIRVEKPAELAQWALGWDAGKVDQAMHSGADNQSVKLPRKIPVYITYFTAYADNGAVHFGNDLYDRDDALVQATAKASEPNPAVQQAVAGLRALAKS